MEWFSDFGMREWLISCGIVLVLVVLIDGFRRMRAERRGEIKMALRMGGEFPDLADEPPTNAELPNGGGRVIDRGDESANRRSNKGTGESEHGIEMTGDLETIHSKSQADANEFDEPVPVSGEQQILVLHAKSRADSGFNGSDLLQILLACDMRYGDRDILHRHEQSGGEGQLQFSVANMVEPGVFNLEDIGSFRTPGVTFFMTLPGADELENAFDCMLETANCLAKNLDADLFDDAHNPLTPEMTSSYRRRVQGFVRATATA